jgi:hypothetical protein
MPKDETDPSNRRKAGDVDRQFVRFVDTQRKEHVINIRQIIEIRHEVDSWEVWLTKGDAIRLAPEEAEKFLKLLPGAEPKQLNVH